MNADTPPGAEGRGADAPAAGTVVRRGKDVFSSPSRSLIWFGTVLIAASLISVVLVLWHMRDVALDKAKADLRRLALSQAELTAAALKGADLALLSMTNDLKRAPGEPETRHRMLQSMVATLPQLNNLFIVDPSGNSRYSARSNPPPQLPLADSPFFKAHEAGQIGLLLTPTFRTRVDGRWTLLLSRRLENEKGEFQGVVVAGIDPLYLASIYAAIDLGPNAAIALLTRDAVMLSRYPWIEGRIGRPVEGGTIAELQARSRSGTAEVVSPTDHVARIYGYAGLEEFPVVVRTVLDTSVALADWRRQAYVGAAWVIGADAIIAALIGLLVTHMRRRERSEARFRDFAEAASDWYWETDPLLRFTYVSRSGRGQAEFPVHDALGRSLGDLIVAHPGDPTWTQLQANIDAFRMFREFLCQVRTPAGRIAHLNLSGMPRFDSRGEFLGYRGVARDITAVVQERSVSARANMRFLYAMEHGTNGFSFWDAEDRFVVCNEVYRQRAGRAAKLLVPGVSFEKFYWEGIRLGEVPSPAGRAADVLTERMAHHRQATGEAMVREMGGRRMLSRDLRTPDGGTLIVFTDIGDIDGFRPVEIKSA
jgi:PAS domain S-box-containing protein